MAEKYEFIVTDPMGLHAKPLTVLVNEASKYDSVVKLIYERKEANLKSIMGTMALGVPTKARLIIEVEGQDEQEAIENLKLVLKEQKITD